jgi:hypothetical protein
MTTTRRISVAMNLVVCAVNIGVAITDPGTRGLVSLAAALFCGIWVAVLWEPKP